MSSWGSIQQICQVEGKYKWLKSTSLYFTSLYIYVQYIWSYSTQSTSTFCATLPILELIYLILVCLRIYATNEHTVTLNTLSIVFSLSFRTFIIIILLFVNLELQALTLLCASLSSACIQIGLLSSAEKTTEGIELLLIEIFIQTDSREEDTLQEVILVLKEHGFNFSDCSCILH